MSIYRPELIGLSGFPELEMKATHPKHITIRNENFLNQGRQINELGAKTGAVSSTRTGTFGEAMLSALDKVSAANQLASSKSYAALIDPDSVDVHDITIAQAEARMSLDITRNVLNRIVQSWRDLINTR